MFIKMHRAFHLRAIPSLFIIAFMIVMIIAPVIIHILEKGGNELLARIMAYSGYIWMAIIFIFFTFHLLFDFLRLFVALGGWVLKRDFSSVVHAHSIFFLAAFIASISVAVYGYYEARNIRLERVVINTDKISKDIGRIKVAQISDLHIGMLIRNNRVKRVIDIIKREDPDILVSTGDLVDGKLPKHKNGNNGFKEINPRLGKFAVLGNHEFYTGIKSSIESLQEEGFVLLRGRAVTIDGIINIAGVDDPAGKPFNYIEIAESDLLRGLPQDRFTILLKHQPIIDPESLKYIDLQLSGHTHGGQIYPFIYITRIFYPFPSGLVSLSRDKFLYISRGTGTWGPPIRFLAPPEVTIVEIKAN
ncbi:MAG: metallophosphoesterase [Syntrophorhabdales bacterium]|nr:metallophosphoesterase [Syntrophorhabdales bacterium]